MLHCAVLCHAVSCCVQVTTKKGYDGCRKAEYLFAHQPITDKTFASLGETTISNLKNTFEGVDTGAGAEAWLEGAASRQDICSQLLYVRPPHVSAWPSWAAFSQVVCWLSAGVSSNSIWHVALLCVRN
jgi:hypothetical protein